MITPQTQPERKEIIQLNGITILAVLVVIANFMIVGFIYRYHSHVLFSENKIHNTEYGALLLKQHDLHEEIIKLEHVAAWNDTAYVKALRLPELK